MDKKIIRDARKRIKKIRQKDVEIVVQKEGEPVSGANVSVRMKEHQFLFGANCYMYDDYEGPEMNEKFTELFVKLFNYTMIPFHWGWFEPEYQEYNEPYTSNLIKWAKANNIKRKLHALIWDWVCPDWITDDDDITERYRERISYIMENYSDDFNFIDLANETTVNDRYPNPVSRWIKEFGPLNMLEFGTKLVRSYKTEANLLYNDWNVHQDEYYDFLRKMRENNIDIDIIGIQSHMHKERWSAEETMEIIDRAAAFDWPLHFTECSICSGKPVGEINYTSEKAKTNEWSETEKDLYSQAEYARDFYTLVFSHPAVEALSWFDFTDYRWLGAPAGVVSDDLQIKPVYNTLDDLINNEWHSDVDLVTGSTGKCETRLFFGNYEITVDINGEKYTVNRDILRESFYSGGGKPWRWVINL